VRTVREIEHDDAVSSGSIAEQYPEMHPHEWTKQAVITLEDGMEAYMVEVIAESHCYKQQLTPCRFATCLRP